jgi:hypothetical protein
LMDIWTLPCGRERPKRGKDEIFIARVHVSN